MSTRRTRRLTFEPLETKCSPTSLLLFYAPLDESDQLVAETSVQASPERASPEQGFPRLELSEEGGPSQAESPVHEPGDVQVSTSDLLAFIARNTRSASRDLAAAPHPSPQECSVAEEMMRATDTELRNLISTRSEFRT